MESASIRSENGRRRRAALVCLAAASALAIAVVPRALFVRNWAVNFDSDEALVALTATRIAAGQFFLFLPGQAYMGPLQSGVAAPLIHLFGPSPAVARMAATLWILPGLFALWMLERRASGGMRRLREAAFLGWLYLLPPAPLFFAGVKIRGGYLEFLVLGLGAVALLWPRDDEGARARSAAVRGLLGGILLGVAIWTHDQALLFLPVVAVLLWVRPTYRIASTLSLALGAAAGYAPLWLPRIAAFALGPPGLAGNSWSVQADVLHDVRTLRDSAWAWIGAATAHTGTDGMRVTEWAYAAILAVAAALGFGTWAFRLARPRTGRSPAIPLSARLRRESPTMAVAVLLGAGCLAAVLADPAARSDPQWFRYTLPMAFSLTIAAAYGLCRLPLVPATLAAGALGILSIPVSLHAKSDWEYPQAPLRMELVGDLLARGVRHAECDWQLAYFIRFMTSDRVLCSAWTPSRFPEVNATVTLAADTWTVRGRKRWDPRPWTRPTDLQEAFLLFPRRVPSDVPIESLAEVDCSAYTTLFAHDEPFPLLASGEFRRDWRGLPYVRPLRRFDQIVWLRDQADRSLVGFIEAHLKERVESGEFQVVQSWRGGMILRRAATAA